MLLIDLNLDIVEILPDDYPLYTLEPDFFEIGEEESYEDWKVKNNE